MKTKMYLEKKMKVYAEALVGKQLDPASFMFAPSLEPFNRDVAEEAFGSHYIQGLVERHLDENGEQQFCGDWWQLAFLEAQAEPWEQPCDYRVVKCYPFPEMDVGCSPSRLWNEWRAEYSYRPPDKYIDVLNAGVFVSQSELERYDRRLRYVRGPLDHSFAPEDKETRLVQIHLEGMSLFQKKLTGCDLGLAHLQGSRLLSVCFDRASFWCAHIENSVLANSLFRHADLRHVDFGAVNFHRVNLSNSILDYTIFTGCKGPAADQNDRFVPEDVNLSSASMRGCELGDSYWLGALLDSSTNMEGAIVNSRSIFLNSNIQALQEHKVRSQLHYARRRFSWEVWYREGNKSIFDVIQDDSRFVASGQMNVSVMAGAVKRVLSMIIESFRVVMTMPIRLFWFSTNYGYSARRLLLVFFSTTLLFSMIYWGWGIYDIYVVKEYEGEPGIVRNLFLGAVDSSVVPWGVETVWSAFLRACYFSLITMTTLGFGDMYAKAGSHWGYGLVAFQVFLGFIFFAALTTRLAVLFTSDGAPIEIPKWSKTHRQQMVHSLASTLMITALILFLVKIGYSHVGRQLPLTYEGLKVVTDYLGSHTSQLKWFAGNFHFLLLNITLVFALPVAIQVVFVQKGTLKDQRSDNLANSLCSGFWTKFDIVLICAIAVVSVGAILFMGFLGVGWWESILLGLVLFIILGILFCCVEFVRYLHFRAFSKVRGYFLVATARRQACHAQSRRRTPFVDEKVIWENAAQWSGGHRLLLHLLSWLILLAYFAAAIGFCLC